jgi:hypothetical protein
LRFSAALAVLIGVYGMLMGRIMLSAALI